MSRLLEINTHLGKVNLLLRHLSGREELGRMPEYHLSLVDKRGDINASDQSSRSLNRI